MNSQLQTISNNVGSTFSGDSFLDTDPVKYQSTLDSLYYKYYNSTLPNPKPSGTPPTVVPNYITVYIKF